MATIQISSLKSPNTRSSFTRALALAVHEWVLIFMLFINAIFSYLITKFADYSQLQTPCLLCSRLDHILGNKRLKHYWDLICSKHKSEISSLVFCHTHGKLVDVHGMCETCLFSFATINKSNAETYRLLVGKLGEDSCFGFCDDSLHEVHGLVTLSTRYCTCCNQLWVPRGYTRNLAEPERPLKLSSFGHSKRSEKQSSLVRDKHKKKVGFNHLPHVGYTELKIHSDTESEVAFSDDDDDKDHKFQTVDLEPRSISLSYDSATEKLINPVSASEPLVLISDEKWDVTKASGISVGHGLEELNWQNINLKDELSSVSELISLHDVPLTSYAQEYDAGVLKESELISFNGVPSTSEAREHAFNVLKESELMSLNDVPLISEARGYDANVLKENILISLNDVPSTSDAQEHVTGVLKENEFISLSDLPLTSDAGEYQAIVLKENESLSVNEVHLSENVNESSLEVSKENDIISLVNHPVSDPSSNSVESMVEVSTESCDTRSVEMKQTAVTENGELLWDRSEPIGSETAPEAKPSPNDSSTLQVPEAAPETNLSFSDTTLKVPETAPETNTFLSYSTLQVPEAATETNASSNDSNLQLTDALDLSDAYTIAVPNRGKQQNSTVQEQWTGKDSSRVSEDLKVLLMQISVSARGIELSPKDISPKISVNSDDLKNFDGVQLLLQRKFSLERNESNLSLEGVTVCEIEGESEIDRLKRQVEHDKRLLNGLYKELEEERNASAVAANQAMAMITRLQEEKAMLQMEALQNLRMMEEQAEYDMEALHKNNDLLTEKEKEIQDLEAELEFYQMKFPDVLTTGNVVARNETMGRSDNPGELEKHDTAKNDNEADMPCNGMSNVIKNSLLGFEDERLYVSECLEKIEKKLRLFSNNGIYLDISNGEYSREEDGISDSKDLIFEDGSKDNFEIDENHFSVQENVNLYEKSKDLASLGNEVSELHERLETLKGDLYFLEHIINSLKHGDEGVQFIKEIATQLQTLRSIGVRRKDEAAN